MNVKFTICKIVIPFSQESKICLISIIIIHPVAS